MKRFTMLWLILIMAQAGWGQTFSIQGVLKDQSGKTLANGYYSVAFSLYETPTGGSALWSETIPSLLTVNGLFETELGAVTPFGSLAFDRTYWLGVAVGKQAEMPRMQLVTIPYSFAVKGVQNRFPSTGNVGIGMTEPDSKLSVSGADGTYVTVQSSGGEAGYALAENGTNRWIIRRMTADSTLRVTEAGVVDALVVRPGGKVGIGTDTPASRLHVGSGQLTVDGDLTSGSDAGGLLTGSSRFVGGDGADKLGIRTGDAWRLTVTPEGKVGIGTADPAAALEVAGNIKISGGGNVVFPDSTSLASLETDFAADTVTNPVNLLITADRDANATGGHQFRTGDKAQMVLTNDGKLGIGTATPGRRLDVTGDVNFSGELTRNGIPVTTSPWTAEGNDIVYGRGHVGIGMEIPTYTLDVKDAVNVTQKIYQNGEEAYVTPWRTPSSDICTGCMYSDRGYVDVGLPSGVTKTSYALHTSAFTAGGWWILRSDDTKMYLRQYGSGDRYLGSLSNMWGDTYVALMYGQNFTQLSDRRAKRNIRPVTGGLEQVMRLSGIRYDINTETHPSYKGMSDELLAKTHEKLTDLLGYDAQELKEVVPELVEYDEKTGYYQIRNGEQLLPVMTEAIQDINAENAALEERIEQLEAGIRKLKEEQ